MGIFYAQSEKTFSIKVVILYVHKRKAEARVQDDRLKYRILPQTKRHDANAAC